MSDRFMSEDRYYRQPILDPKEYKRIIYDPGLVTRIIINRPRYMNTTSHAALAELEDAFDRASEDEACHVIVISGAGPCFSSGDDTVGLTPESAPTLWDGDARPPEKLIEEYGSESAVWHQYNIEHDHLITWWPFHKLRTIPKPTIAMVHSWCIFMAFSIATSMDLIFASEDAMFLPLQGPKTIWDLGGRKALEFTYEHRFLTAGEAHELGMVNRVFLDHETLEKETMAFAYRVAYESPLALRRAKEEHLNIMDTFGFTAAFEANRSPFFMNWRRAAEAGHRNRYEGRAMARTPVALRNLKSKLDSEGAEVPEHVLAALARAAARDDRASWDRALHQPWRSGDRVARTDDSSRAYDEMRAEFEEKRAAEIARRGLSV